MLERRKVERMDLKISEQLDCSTAQGWAFWFVETSVTMLAFQSLLRSDQSAKKLEIQMMRRQLLRMLERLSAM